MPNKSARRRYGKYLPLLFGLSDLLIVNLLFALSLHFNPQTDAAGNMRTVWVILNSAFLPILFWTLSRARPHRAITMDVVIKDALLIVVTHLLLFTSLMTFVQIDLTVREYVTFYSLMLVGEPLWWLLSRFILKLLRMKGYNYVSVVIIGSGPLAVELYRELQADSGFGYMVLGAFADNPGRNTPLKILGNIDSLNEYLRHNHVDQIFFAIAGVGNPKLAKVIKVADDNMIQFYYVPQIPGKVARSFELYSVGTVPVLSMRRNPLSSHINRALKRSFDIAFSGLFLIFSPLVFIPVAIAIKLSSPGPVFFKQKRTGYKGKTFDCYKFRTMRVNAQSNVRQATEDDPRVTKVGKFLRHSSIDELPQFINVLKGDMSIVGPRPHMLKHTEEYSQLIGPYMVRHIVKPGITGYAQVRGYRGITDELWKMERRVECDVWYIENWSFLLDLKIIMRTVINGFVGDENAF